MPQQPTLFEVIPVETPEAVHGKRHAGKTRSTREALDLLTETRRTLIEVARLAARTLIRRDGTTHSRAVRESLAAQGLLAADDSEYWLGAVFATSEFQWTGDLHTYSDPARNIHERTVKVWRLR